MAGQGDEGASEADRRVRDGIIDARADRTINRMVGAPPPIVGGGGDNGTFTFVNVSEIDEIITRLSTVCDRIRRRGIELDHARQHVRPLAMDPASNRQATAAIASLSAAQRHNAVLLKNTDDYVVKLRAARAETVGTEQENTTTLSPHGHR